LVKYLLLKYLRFDRSQPFIMLSALLAFFGVGIGVAVLMNAMAIMNGFDKEFERKLFTMNYPITIVSGFKGTVTEDDVKTLKEKFPHLKFSPYISTQTVLRSENRIEGGVMFGVNFKDEAEINSVLKEALNATKTLEPFEIVVGKGIQMEFGIEVGEKLTAMFMKTQAAGFAIIPQMKRFAVAGVFSSGLNAYDKAYSYTSIESLAKVLGYEKGKFDGVHVYSKEPQKEIKALNEALGFDKRAIGWWQQNGNFFSALALEKRALFIVLMLIILVASLNIISSLLMNVMNRRSEIALLLSLGASRAEVKKSFLAQGLVIGGGGIVFGVLLGFLAYFLLGSFDLVNLPADVYGSSKLPLELSTLDFFGIVVGAVVIVFVSSLYPAAKASKIDILETLRNE